MAEQMATGKKACNLIIRRSIPWLSDNDLVVASTEYKAGLGRLSISSQREGQRQWLARPLAFRPGYASVVGLCDGNDEVDHVCLETVFLRVNPGCGALTYLAGKASHRHVQLPSSADRRKASNTE